MIDVRDVHFAYNSKEVLSGISFNISSGEMVAIMGPNSSGKSTLLHVTCGILQPHKGKVIINSKPLDSFSRREIAMSVALVPQIQPTGLPFTAAQTVLMGRNPHKSALSLDNENDIEIVSKVLKATNTYQLRDRYLDELSGGERQCVMIAKALAQETFCLLLDEPTAFLDVKHQIDVMEMLKKLNKEHRATILLVSHDINLAVLYCSRVILIREGKIIADGKTNDVITPENLKAAYDVEMSIIHDGNGIKLVVPRPQKVSE
ncbi:MAG: ABC transporter ATP-binding protein [Planctomycetota bacterium]